MQGAVYRRRQINSARDQGEQSIERVILPALQSRYRAVARDLRKGNLRKRFVKSGGDLFKSEADTWEGWEVYFTETLKNSLVTSVSFVWDAEQRYFISNEFQPFRIDPAEVLARYQMRVQRNIGDIAVDTKRDVNKAVVDWFNSGRGLPELISELQQYFSSSRASLIASTEMAYVASTIADMMMGEYGIQEWQWDAFRDGVTCGLCFGLMEQSRLVPFRRGDPMPPDPSHPRCRCGVYFIGVDVKVKKFIPSGLTHIVHVEKE